MPKKIVQDVVPPENKSIRNIPVPPRRRATTTTYRDQVTDIPTPPPEIRPARMQQTTKEVPPLISEPPHSIHSTSFGFKKVLIGICILVVLFFGISALFVSAEVSITPKTESVNLNKSVVAKKTPDTNELGYEIITLSKEIGKKVEAQGEEKVEKKASGKIVIYNKNSASTQKLIANTRFESPSGLIYRISDAVTVPGYTKKGTDIMPGSITVTVYADKAGEGYNTDLTDFTIPGFKDDPRFKTIYARSETPMQGGFSGTVKKVTPETLSLVQTELENQLKEELTKEIASQIPDQYVMYPGTTSFSFESLPQSESTDTSVKVNEKGTITALVLHKETLQKELSSETLTAVNPGEVYVSNLSSLDVSFPAVATLSRNQTQDVTLSVKGNASFVWNVDKVEIQKDLANKPKKSLSSVLSTHPEVEKAKVILRPFWKRSFPKNSEKIEVRIVEDQG